MRTVGSTASPAARAHTTLARVLRLLLIPAFSVAYLIGTPDGPNRTVMFGVVAGIAAGVLLAVVGAGLVAPSGRRPIQVLGAVVSIIGVTFLALLDGGVISPFGVFLPFCLVFFAVLTPQRVFWVLAVATAAGYWLVVVAADASVAPEYPWSYCLGYGGVAYLCMRHRAALASLGSRLAEVSRVDGLTGCLNRRGFDERLTAEFAEAQRTGDSLTLIVADLDRFKEVNDTYGHRTGDELLAWTGHTLSEGLRVHDAVGRTGGDEFAAVLSDTDPAGAQLAVQRLRGALGLVAPASLGHASYPAEATTLVELKHLADQRAYRAKTTRDRKLPSQDTVVAARAGMDRRPTAKVSGGERRRRSIGDMGRVSMTVCGAGLVLIAAFGVGQSQRVPMAFLLAAGWMVGALTTAVTNRLSRSAAVRHWMVACGVVQFTIAGCVVGLDGGVSSAMAVGLLAPIPLVALTTPPRVGLPLVGCVGATYLGLAVFVGAANAWQVAAHLGGTVAIAVICAKQGTIAARQRRLLAELSRVDVLTDSLNRRGFEERFAAELAHARRTARNMSLLIFDLDGFKQVNDVHGHAAGDELLCWVAATLRANLHPHDVTGRLGGDEFLVQLTSHASHDARAVAEQLRTALAERTAASVGVASLGEHGTTFDALYGHADAELYACKARRGGQGRSRTPAAG